MEFKFYRITNAYFLGANSSYDVTIELRRLENASDTLYLLKKGVTGEEDPFMGALSLIAGEPSIMNNFSALKLAIVRIAVVDANTVILKHHTKEEPKLLF